MKQRFFCIGVLTPATKILLFLSWSIASSQPADRRRSRCQGYLVHRYCGLAYIMSGLWYTSKVVFGVSEHLFIHYRHENGSGDLTPESSMEGTPKFIHVGNNTSKQRNHRLLLVIATRLVNTVEGGQNSVYRNKTSWRPFGFPQTHCSTWGVAHGMRR